MPKQSGQRLKLMHLHRLLLVQTDEQHPMTAAALIAALSAKGIPCERKSLYADIEALRQFGLNVEYRGGTDGGYFVADRAFELAELKLLVDAIQSSKFITHRKSRALIHKVEKLASRHQSALLQRQVHVAGRIKAMNESVYYNIDGIHAAISAGQQIRFRYIEWTLNLSDPERLKKRFRRGDAFYTVSPWALLRDDENYYLIAFDADADAIRHYRVDRMEQITGTDLPRQGKAAFAQIDLARYTNRMFGMFGGTETPVRLRCANRLVGVIVDRFGRDVSLIPDGPDHFLFNTEVVLSPQFYAWVFGFGREIKLLAPAHAVEELHRMAREMLEDET